MRLKILTDILLLCPVNVDPDSAHFHSSSTCVKFSPIISSFKNYSSESALNKLINGSFNNFS